MAQRKWTVADSASYAALAVVGLAVNISLLVFTDIDTVLRCAASVLSGTIAALTAYVIVSRRIRSRG